LVVTPNKTKVIPYENKISPIDPDSYQKLKTGLPATAATEIKILPELHVEGGSTATAAPVAFRIMFTLDQQLRYNDTLKKFTARLAFLLVNESGDNTTAIEPVRVEVQSNDLTSIHPGHISIDHLSIPSTYIDVAGSYVSDSVAVKLSTTSNPAGYTTYLKVMPTLEISTNAKKVQGFGIQEIPVQVRFKGSNSNDSALVSLSTSKGSISPNPVAVKYNNSATVYLRSDGIGNSKLSAISGSINSNEINFKFTFPWLFLISSILGGLIGSLAKYFLSSGEKGSAIKPIMGGILIGFIGAVAYYGLGVNLLGIKLSAGLNALAVLALSALCAYFGISLIKLDGNK